MIDIPLGALFAVLAVCIVISAFFSGSETAMMALNRYRLRHLASRKHKGAMRANALLERPDRLIGLILIGNNFVIILASQMATVIGLELYGEAGIAVAAGVLTLVLLIFGEVGPKTLAVLYPERIAFATSHVLSPLLKLCYPLVWIVSGLTNGILRAIGVRAEDAQDMALSRAELRTVVKEAGAMIPRRHQQMLLGILDLEQVTVEDIMVPRGDIVGIDLDDGSATLAERLSTCVHTRLPVCRGGIDNVVGLLHVRQLPRLYGAHAPVDIGALEKLLVEPYYVPIGTPLHTQLSNFQREKRRMGLVIDEYGEIQGLVTLEDILEEIVGEFTTAPQVYSRDIFMEEDGSYLIDGSANIREVNRSMRWKLPTTGPKTVNGLITEALESIPETGTALRIKGYTIEILQTTGQSVKVARITPPAKKPPRSTGGRNDNHVIAR